MWFFSCFSLLHIAFSSSSPWRPASMDLPRRQSLPCALGLYADTNGDKGADQCAGSAIVKFVPEQKENGEYQVVKQA